jgi:hypothetical protein
MNVKTLVVSVLILIFTSSCSGTYRAYYQTLKIAFSETNDADMTSAEVTESRIDVISVKRGDRPSSILALAYLEDGQHKWISSDNAMLIMEKGRIIRSLGLSDDLLYLSNLDIDPLKSLSHSAITKHEPKQVTWTRISDRSGDEYGYTTESTFSQARQDTVQALSLNIDAILYIEYVTYKAPANYLRLSKSWENLYWYNKTGDLIKSVQKISPISETLEITYLSRIERTNQ